MLAFDKVFPPDLMQHLCNLFNSSPDTMMFVSTHPGLTVNYNLHAYEAHREPATFTGSSQNCTLHFYLKNVNRSGRGTFLQRVYSRLQSLDMEKDKDVIVSALQEQQKTLFNLLLVSFLPSDVRHSIRKKVARLSFA